MVPTQNAITYLRFNVTNVIFERPDDFQAGEFQINIEHIPLINKSDKNLFQTIFIATITSKDKSVNIQVKAAADFKVIGEVEKAIYDNFVNINAPAIAFPYLRAFVSNLTVQAGMAPIILPPVNFTSNIKPSEKE